MLESSENHTFRWACLGSAILFGLVLLWMITDFKQRVLTSLDRAEATIATAQQSVEQVNEKMPLIMQEIQQTSATLGRVADDVELMKRVAGIDHEDTSRGVRGLATYADEVQRLLADETDGKEASIWKEEIFGKDLLHVESVAEFLVGLNKEMVVAILPLSKSRQEILWRTCHSGPPRRIPFYIKLDENEPILLEEFIKQHHQPSASLPPYKVE